MAPENKNNTPAGQTEARINEMTRRLTEALAPNSIEITDDSHQHIGHAGAATGLGHFTLTISGGALEGQNRIHAHRMVYDALGNMMQTDIHALKITIKPA